MKKNTLFFAISALLSANTFAGGIILHEVATFDNVSSAGVGNTTNRKDASAAITNPAGLTSIEDSSWSFGLQVVDAKTIHRGQANLIGELNTKGTATALAPSLAYAKRVHDDLVLGVSLHADGGLGMEYQNGPSGYGFIDSQSQEFVNINLAAGYALNDQWSIGGAFVIQHMMTTIDIDRSLIGGAELKAEGEDGNTEVSFMLSTMYDINERTFISANYKHRVDHSNTFLDLDASIGNSSARLREDISVYWPSQLSFGIQHKIDDAMTLKGMLGAEFWSDFSESYKMEDVYTIGTALAYQANAWTYQAGVRFDSKMMKAENMQPELAVGQNWSLGLGAEMTRSNGHRIGLAYQYRDMGTADVAYDNGVPVLPNFSGSIKENRLHILSLSYAY